MDRDIVGLLRMISDMAHNHDESKLGLVAIIKCDLELALSFQGKTKDCDDFMAVLKARVDIINAYKGSSGRHPGHLRDTFDRITVEKGLLQSAITNMAAADKEEI